MCSFFTRSVCFLGVGFRVYDVGFGVYDVGFRVYDVGFRVCNLVFRVEKSRKCYLLTIAVFVEASIDDNW